MRRPPPGQMVINMKTTITTHGQHNGVIVHSGIHGSPATKDRGRRAVRGPQPDPLWPYPSTSQFPSIEHLPTETPLPISRPPTSNGNMNRASPSPSRLSPTLVFSRDSPPDEWIPPEKITLNVFQTGPPEIFQVSPKPVDRYSDGFRSTSHSPYPEYNKRMSEYSRSQEFGGATDYNRSKEVSRIPDYSRNHDYSRNTEVSRLPDYSKSPDYGRSPPTPGLIAGGEGVLNDQLTTTTTVEVFRTPIDPSEPDRIILPPAIGGRDDRSLLVRTQGPDYERWTNSRTETLINDTPLLSPQQLIGQREREKAVQWKENLVDRESAEMERRSERGRSPAASSSFSEHLIRHPPMINTFDERINRPDERQTRDGYVTSPPSTSTSTNKDYARDRRTFSPSRPVVHNSTTYGPPAAVAVARDIPVHIDTSYETIPVKTSKSHPDYRNSSERRDRNPPPHTNPRDRRRAHSTHRPRHHRRDAEERRRENRGRSESPGREAEKPLHILPSPSAQQYSPRTPSAFSPSMLSPNSQPEEIFALYQTRDALSNVVGHFDLFDNIRSYDEDMLVSPLAESEDSLISDMSARNDKTKSDYLETKPAPALNVDNILRHLNNFSRDPPPPPPPNEWRSKSMRESRDATSRQRSMSGSRVVRKTVFGVNPAVSTTSSSSIHSRSHSSDRLPPPPPLPIVSLPSPDYSPFSSISASLRSRPLHSTSSYSSSDDPPPIPRLGPFSPHSPLFPRTDSSSSAYFSGTPTFPRTNPSHSTVPRGLRRTKPLDFHPKGPDTSPNTAVFDHVYDSPEYKSKADEHIYETISRYQKNGGGKGESGKERGESDSRDSMELVESEKEKDKVPKLPQRVVSRPEALNMPVGCRPKMSPILPTDPDEPLFGGTIERREGAEKKRMEENKRDQKSADSQNVQVEVQVFVPFAEPEDTEILSPHLVTTTTSYTPTPQPVKLVPAKAQIASEAPPQSVEAPPTYSIFSNTMFSAKPKKAHPDGLQFPKITKSTSLSQIPEDRELTNRPRINRYSGDDGAGIRLMTSLSFDSIDTIPFVDESPRRLRIEHRQAEFREVEEEPCFLPFGGPTATLEGPTVTANEHRLFITGFEV